MGQVWGDFSDRHVTQVKQGGGQRQKAGLVMLQDPQRRLQSPFQALLHSRGAAT